MKLLLTGGCGLIGSAVIRHVIRKTDHVVVNVDGMIYAASEDEDALEETRQHPRHILERADITDASAMRQIFETHCPDAVMHLAVESHVDRSIDGPASFVQSNVVGAFVLLEAARAYWATLDSRRKVGFKFHHVSTHGVSGALDRDDPLFTETTSCDPRSPYSASKTASDHLLVRAWRHTNGPPTLVSNYGPWQFPERLIPLVTMNALRAREAPVCGNGSTMRDWLFVEDHAEALMRVLEHDAPGATYAIGGRQPRTNLQAVQAICSEPDRKLPDPVEIDPSRSERALEWKASHDFDAGLARTVEWHISNHGWREASRVGAHAGQRLETCARVDA